MWITCTILQRGLDITIFITKIYGIFHTELNDYDIINFFVNGCVKFIFFAPVDILYKKPIYIKPIYILTYLHKNY